MTTPGIKRGAKPMRPALRGSAGGLDDGKTSMNSERFWWSIIFVLLPFTLSGCKVSNTSSGPLVKPRVASSQSIVSDQLAVEKETIRFLEDRVKKDPEDFIAYNKLAQQYLQRLRETGDLTYLNLA